MDFGRSTARVVHEHVSDSGSLAGWEVEPQIFVTKAVGRMEVAHAEAWVRIGDHMVATGRPFVGIHDWSEMEAYDSETRKMLQAWTMANRKPLIAVHIAVRSRLVRMGVTVANLALGNFFQTHDDVASLSRAYLETLASHRRERPTLEAV